MKLHANQVQRKEVDLMQNGEFSVCQFFPDGSCEYVCRFVEADVAMKTAKQCTTSASARVGRTHRVIIVDGLDFCCFEWKFGKGVTFPPQQNVNDISEGEGPYGNEPAC